SQLCFSTQSLELFVVIVLSTPLLGPSPAATETNDLLGVLGSHRPLSKMTVPRGSHRRSRTYKCCAAQRSHKFLPSSRSKGKRENHWCSSSCPGWDLEEVNYDLPCIGVAVQ